MSKARRSLWISGGSRGRKPMQPVKQGPGTQAPGPFSENALGWFDYSRGSLILFILLPIAVPTPFTAARARHGWDKGTPRSVIGNLGRNI